MANNQFDMNLTRYTHRDYDSIKQDLIDAIPSLTQEWTSTSDSDPGIVLIKLMSMFGDTLSYNIDKIALELYLQSVTQRKNCAKILELLGYKMHWYRSAKVVAQVKFAPGSGTTDGQEMIIRPYDTVFSAGNIDYAYVDTEYGDLYIRTGGETLSPSVNVKLVQGTPSSDTFGESSLTNNRYYLSTLNIDESHLHLYISNSNNTSILEAKLIDNIYLAPGGQHVYFSFNVDEYNQPYIQLSENWRSVVSNTDSIKFTLKYLVSIGANGNISSNAFTSIRNVSSTYNLPSYTNLLINNPANNSDNYTDVFTSSGKGPQTVEDAKKDSANYVFTHDTLVTPSDYEKASKRIDDVTVSKLVDAQVIVNDHLDLEGLVNRCADHFEETVSEGESYLKSYLAILYLAYRNFNPDQNYYYIDGSDVLPDGTILSGRYKLDEEDPYGSAYLTNPDLRDLGYYPYRISNLLQISERELLKDLNILNVEIDFGTLKLFPFKVQGILNLVEPMSPQNTLQVVSNVDEALRQAYYPDLHPVGDKPNFIELVDIIQSADQRIKYFDATGNIVEWAPLINTSPVSYDEESSELPYDIETDDPNTGDSWDVTKVYKYTGNTTGNYVQDYIYKYDGDLLIWIEGSKWDEGSSYKYIGSSNSDFIYNHIYVFYNDSHQWEARSTGSVDNYIDDVFDITSAIMYNGLSDKFTLNSKFLTFTFKNVNTQPDAITLRNYAIEQSEGQSNLPDDYGTAYLYNYYLAQNHNVPPASSADLVRIDIYHTATIVCNSVAELEGLCKDLVYSGTITFTESDPIVINNTGLQYIGG